MNHSKCLIILNGTSSSGKSSIAKAIQRIDGSFLHVQLDAFLHMISDEMQNDNECFYDMYTIMHKTVVAMIDSGKSVVLDTVAIHEATIRMNQDLKGCQAFCVAVKAPLPIVQQREMARGDRYIGLAESQFKDVHENIVYDFEIDTSLHTVDEAAREILRRVIT